MKTIYWVIIALVLYIYCNKNMSGFGKNMTATKQKSKSAQIIEEKEKIFYSKFVPEIERVCKSFGLKYVPPKLDASDKLGLGHCLKERS